MKQRFTKRTRLVSALLTLAMVFTFLPFSAFATTVKVIVEELAFTTHGCDALQITEGGSIADWIAAFRKKMENENEGEKPINATSGYGFYVRQNYNDWFVADEPYQLYATETGSFQSGETYYLCVPIRAAEGYFFNTARDFKFKKITVDGEDLSVVLKKTYPYADANNNRVYIPLSFKAKHSPKIIYGKDATCITYGVVEHYECKKCSKLFMDYACTEETTPANVQIKPNKSHHNLGDWNKAWSRHYKRCKDCKKYFDTGAHDFVGGRCTDCGLERHDLDNAEVEVTELAAGMTPAMIAAKNVTPDKKTAFSTACTWYEADSGAELSDTAAFVEGKQYRAELKLTARVEWQFLDSTTYKINGTAAEKDSSSDAAPWEQVTLSRIFTAKPATEGKVITNIQMTIPAPVAGNSPSSCKAQKSDPRYTIRYRWAEVDAAGNTITHEVTTFEEGKHYRVAIVPEPNTGYEFEDGEQDAIINGKAYSSFTSPGMNPKRFKEYYVILTAVAGGGSTGGSTGGGSTEAGKYQLTVTDGVATVNGITSDVLNVKPGDTVTLTADTTKFPENEEFGWWEITPYGSVSNTLTGQYQRTATFTMPNENVSARAMSKSAGVSTGGDDGGGGGGAAILLVGGAAVAGLVGYGVYSYVSEQQLKALLPEGVAMPENRAQTALLLWNTAGRPEPAEAPAFKDVADPDTAKAAQWCVEHGLMDQKLGGRFAPDNSDPAYKTLNAYQQLVG